MKKYCSTALEFLLAKGKVPFQQSESSSYPVISLSTKQHTSTLRHVLQHSSENPALQLDECQRTRSYDTG
jgi:hypothetical protein